jgi:transcriptional regulator with XRE-family HTH domain
MNARLTATQPTTADADGTQKTVHIQNIKRNPRLAAKVREYRRKAGLTQQELARVTGIKREYISSCELGRVGVIYPEAFNALRRALGFPGWELLEAIGYRTDVGEADINPGLLTLLRQLSPEQQQAVLDIVRGVLKARDELEPQRSAS